MIDWTPKAASGLAAAKSFRLRAALYAIFQILEQAFFPFLGMTR
jgi:hypothetical protein